MNQSYPFAQIDFMDELFTPYPKTFPILDRLIEKSGAKKYHFIIGGYEGLCAEDIALYDSHGNTVNDVIWKPLRNFEVSANSISHSSDGKISINSDKSIFLCTEAVYSPYDYKLSLKLDSAKEWFYFGISVSGHEDSTVLGGDYEDNKKAVLFIVPEKRSNRISFWDVEKEREWIVNRTDFDWGGTHTFEIKKLNAENQFILDDKPITTMGNEIAPHSHFCYELSYVYSGSGVIQVNGTDYFCPENSFVLTKPNEIHSFKSSSACRLICVGFFYDISQGFLNQSLYDFSKVIRKIITQLDYELKLTPKHYKCVAYEYLKLIIITLLRTQNPIDTPVLDKAVLEILSNLSENIDSKKLASDLGYSYHRFRHLFKQYSGLSLSQYTVSLRIHHAMYLLHNTKNSIQEIARISGFNSVPKFTNAFLSITNTTPHCYRKMNDSALVLFNTAAIPSKSSEQNPIEN